MCARPGLRGYLWLAVDINEKKVFDLHYVLNYNPSQNCLNSFEPIFEMLGWVNIAWYGGGVIQVWQRLQASRWKLLIFVGVHYAHIGWVNSATLTRCPKEL